MKNFQLLSHIIANLVTAQMYKKDNLRLENACHIEPSTARRN